MARNQRNLQVEVAIGDGNCAFNAFILGLSQPHVLAQIENNLKKAKKDPNSEFKQFIHDSAIALNVKPDWESVKKCMIQLRETDNNKLQLNLQHVIRSLTIQLAKEDKNKEYYKSLIKNLPTALDYHCADRATRAKLVEEDVFNRHDFMVKKFDELRSRLTEENATALEEKVKVLQEHEDFIATHWNISGNESSAPYKKEEGASLKKTIIKHELIKWFHDEGYATFLDNMIKNSIWAGDIELNQIAKYFNVNLYYTTGKADHYSLLPAYTNHGNISLTWPDELEFAKLLAFIGLIDPIKSHSNRSQVQSKLNITDHDAALWLENDLDFSEMAQAIALGNTPETINKYYGIAPHLDHKRVFKFIIGQNDAIKNISAKLNHQDKINHDEAKLIERLRKDRKSIEDIIKNHTITQPEIVVSNPSGIHWNHMILSTETPALSLPELKNRYHVARQRLDKILSAEILNASNKDAVVHFNAIYDAAIMMDKALNNCHISPDTFTNATSNFLEEVKKRPTSITLEQAIKTVVYAAFALVGAMLLFSFIGLLVAGEAAAITALIGLIVAVKGATFAWSVVSAGIGTASAITTAGFFGYNYYQDTPLETQAKQTAEIAKEIFKQVSPAPSTPGAAA